jgi:hypothetical protein
MSSIRYLYMNGKDVDVREREMRRLFFDQLESLLSKLGKGKLLL